MYQDNGKAFQVAFKWIGKLDNPIQKWGKAKKLPTNFSPVTSTNVEMSPNFVLHLALTHLPHRCKSSLK